MYRKYVRLFLHLFIEKYIYVYYLILIIMNIAIIGTGYVGLVTGTCFAEMGTNVTCVDVRRDVVEKLMNGQVHIFEPGLQEMVVKNFGEGRLHFTCSISDVVNESEIIFLAVGTPPGEDGSADLKHVIEVAREIGRLANKYFVLVTKSTVPVGTSLKVRAAVQAELDARGVDIQFDVASNPEFLKEGAAIKDFMSPDRIVIGTESIKAKEQLEKLYKPFMLNGERFIFMDVPSAEMTKYAANCMLATRISFMNEIAGLCELVGADAEMVRKGIGSDPRIGNKFLYPGAGYGGSCFPKDVKALIQTGAQNNYQMQIIEAAERVNDLQKTILYRKLRSSMGQLKDRTIAVWGLSFKPDTDDIREAPAFVLIDNLLNDGARVKVFDPVAMNNTRQIYGDRIEYCTDKYEAAKGSDALVLVTEWRQFRLPDWAHVAEIMAGSIVVDGRNIYNESELRSAGFEYYRIGRADKN